MKMNLMKINFLLTLGTAFSKSAGRQSLVTDFASAESDLEMGADLGMDLGLQTDRSSIGPVSSGGGDSGPATLAEYCAAKPSTSSGVHEGTRVTADWGHYGTMYPGKVSHENEDGTVDIEYDDGFKEDHVDIHDVKKSKSRGGEVKHIGAAGGRDPACKFQKFVGKVKKKLTGLNHMTSQWLAGQRAKIAGDQVTPPKPQQITSAATPSSVTPGGAAAEVSEESKDEAAEKAPTQKAAAQKVSEDSQDEVEKLKAQLGEREDYIKKLEKQAENNNKELKKALPSSPAPAAPGGLSVDGLVAQYKSRIADRDRRIDELLAVIKDQEQELARLGAGQLSLTDIDDAMIALEADVEEGEKKRNELKKSGQLDGELRAVSGGIVKALGKMRKKVDDLIGLDAKAKADRQKADQEIKAAADAARRQAEKKGEDPDKAAAEAQAKAKKSAEERITKADVDTMRAAQEVEQEMHEAGKEATKLDTGVHPHGAKWWRYRYEHSHIEALLMIFISFLMLFWSKVIDHLRYLVRLWAKPSAEAEEKEDEDLSECKSLMDETHGTIYVVWLNSLADQMMVCILVFLTVWFTAKTSLISLFPMLVKASEDMRVPNTAEEYRTLALDICTIFFFAIMFYFCLIASVARSMSAMTSDLERFESDTQRTRSRFGQYPPVVSMTLGVVASSSSDYDAIKEHFVMLMNHEMATSDRKSLKNIGDLNNFPLWIYMKVHVRLTVTRLFTFGWVMWAPTICLFFTLMLLHRFAHMGYVRVMLFFAMLTLSFIVGMGYYTKSILREIKNGVTPEQGFTNKPMHHKFRVETVFMASIQFSILFICYGVARMICQPWMWELHFWPVSMLTVIALVSAALFVWIVAPAIPSFCALQAMPPYMDHHDLKVMRKVAETTKVPQHECLLKRHLSTMDTV